MAQNLQVDDIVSTSLGPISFSKGSKRNIKSLTNQDYTILDTDGYDIILSVNSGSQTITLPSVANNSGRIIEIHKIGADTGALNISVPSGSIDGNSTNVLRSARSRVTLVSDGSNWTVLNVCDVLSSSVLTATNATGNQYIDAASLTLAPGLWALTGTIKYLRNSGTPASSNLLVGYGTLAGISNGADLPGQVQIFEQVSSITATGWIERGLHAMPIHYTTSSSPTIYLKGLTDTFNVGNPQYFSLFTARRIL